MELVPFRKVLSFNGMRVKEFFGDKWCWFGVVSGSWGRGML